MPNLKEIHSRIVSIGSTIQITSAMKMVSAAKLKRAQDAITQMRPYANKLHELLINLSSALDSNEGKYSQERKIKKVLLVSISSNRGLCGGFNANVIKKTIEAYEKYEGNEVDILTIGKKTSDFFTKNDYNLVNSYDEVFADLTFENTSKISEKIMEEFVNEKYDKVEIIYNQFKNAATQILINEQYLPVQKFEEEGGEITGDYIFEPNQQEIVNHLIPKSLKTQLYKAVLDSHAAEHGARMTAMHKATDNAGELKRDLTLQYNKARQAAITAEILEIVGGAEALSN